MALEANPQETEADSQESPKASTALAHLLIHSMNPQPVTYIMWWGHEKGQGKNGRPNKNQRNAQLCVLWG